MGFFRLFKKRRKKRNPPGWEYSYEADHTVIDDYVEFSGLPRDAVVDRVRNNRRINQEAWNEIESKTSDWNETVRSFYASAGTYVFDLLLANYEPSAVLKKLDAFNPKILESIRSHPGRKFLEFGGGVGVFCEVLHREGLDVTYLDIPGHVKDFAEWRFKKYDLPIKVITSSPDRLELEDDYDIVYTDAVFEHLIDPEQVLGDIIAHVRPGGLFVFLVDLGGESDDQPMHRSIDIQRLHAMLHDARFSCEGGEHTFASVWRRAE